jgi:hypothetical protein
MLGNIKRLIMVALALIIVLQFACLVEVNALGGSRPCLFDLIVDASPRVVVVADDSNEERIIDYVPLYAQQDYPNIPFSQGSVSTSGCGITCVAMIASYFRNEFISPGELGKYFNIPGEGNDKRMEVASDALGLPFQEKTRSWNKVYGALQNGQVVISLQYAGLFTNGGHFIVLTGIDENNKIRVNDPNSFNWDKDNTMIAGFTNGFTIDQITKSGVMYWIYEKKPIEKVEYPENWKNTAE